MADPVVHITAGVPDSGTGNITTLGQTLVDGANPAIGATTDAAVTAGATGSLLAKLRSISRDLVANIVLAAGANVIGKVTTDQTTPGTTDLVHAAQSGTWTVQPGNTANTTAWKVDGSAVTQPVSIATAPVLVAGSAIIGKVTTDQTTHGTSDLVAADITKLGGATINLGSGAASTGTLRTILASDSPGIITTGSQAAPSSSYLSVVAAGDIAAAATDSGNPVKIGGVGKTTNPTAVTDGQRVSALFDKLGKMVVVHAIRDLVSDQNTTITASTAATTIVTAVASTFLDLISLTLTNTSATGTEVQLFNDDGTTIRWIGYVPPTDMRGIVFDIPMPQTTVNNTWKLKTVTSITSLKVTAQFIKNI